MTRVKSGTTAHRRHRKIIKAAKGYRGLRSRTFKQAKNAVMKAGMHAYAHRRTKKRDFRSLWIARINAAARPLGVSYSRLIDGMSKNSIVINRKMLAELAVNNAEAFKAIVEKIK
ncbi:50S ribosomal protein L20 [Candidatus Peregrinibacteria bacterium HGW-Peregrinibacteria-1]|nr:MAG: 50S ribosomal protein L20 [Candidatus Peregrinibacteria bacterium HGW-Peregrinibacteria-1]